MNQRTTNPSKDRATLKIYDPYYCMGAVVKHLNSLGFVAFENEEKTARDVTGRGVEELKGFSATPFGN